MDLPRSFKKATVGALVVLALGACSGNEGTKDSAKAPNGEAPLEAAQDRPGTDVCAGISPERVSETLRLHGASSTSKLTVNAKVGGSHCTYRFDDGMAVTVAYLDPGDFAAAMDAKLFGDVTVSSQGFNGLASAGLSVDGEAVAVFAAQPASPALRQRLTVLAGEVLSALEPADG